MKIYGKEFSFFMSVGATAEIAELCKDGNIENLRLIFELPQAEQLLTIAKMVCILANAYEQKKFYESFGNYEKQILTEDIVLSLPSDEFTSMQNEMLEAIINGSKRNVVLKEPKKEEAAPIE